MKKIKYILLFVIAGFLLITLNVFGFFCKGDDHYHYLNEIDFDIYKSDSVIFRNTSNNEMISKVHSINKSENNYFVLDFIFNEIKNSYWQIGFIGLENRKINSIQLFIKNQEKIIEISETLSSYTSFDTLVYCGDNQLNMGSDFQFLTNKFNRIVRGDGDFHSIDYVDIAIPLNLNNLDLEDKIEVTLKVELEGKTFSKTKIYSKTK